MHPSLSPGRISGYPGSKDTKALHGDASVPPCQTTSPGSRDSTFDDDNNTSECISEASQGQQIRVKLTSHVGQAAEWKVTGPQD